jgi:uncharacterized repeat protein (TIGR01451 family)
MRCLSALAPTLALAAGLALIAPAAYAMTATQKVEKEITTTAPDGTVTIKRVKAETVTPGEKVVYTLDITNTNNDAVTDLVVAMPVPADVKYIEGTASRAGTVVKYSADGGVNYTVREGLRVNSPSGMRPASANDITHIQWKISGPINPAQSDSVAFKARLR